jgi:pimeloyl-ACP methyl ester carboxylesterase
MTYKSDLTLVLLPGMDGTGELFENLLVALSPEIKTVVVRYPSSTMLSYEELTELASMQIPKNTPYVLLGESFSGPIAIALAARPTEQLKGVILCCTFAVNPRPLLSKWGIFLPPLAITDKLLRVIAKLLMSGFKNEKVYAQLKATLPKVSPETMRARLDAVIGVNYLAELAKINVPILYLKAKKDHLVPASASKTIAKFAKNVSVVELEAPHLLLQIAPKEAAEVVQNFLELIDKLSFTPMRTND